MGLAQARLPDGDVAEKKLRKNKKHTKISKEIISGTHSDTRSGLLHALLGTDTCSLAGHRGVRNCHHFGRLPRSMHLEIAKQGEEVLSVSCF